MIFFVLLLLMYSSSGCIYLFSPCFPLYSGSYFAPLLQSILSFSAYVVYLLLLLVSDTPAAVIYLFSHRFPLFIPGLLLHLYYSSNSYILLLLLIYCFSRQRYSISGYICFPFFSLSSFLVYYCFFAPVNTLMFCSCCWFSGFSLPWVLLKPLYVFLGVLFRFLPFGAALHNFRGHSVIFLCPIQALIHCPSSSRHPRDHRGRVYVKARERDDE